MFYYKGDILPGMNLKQVLEKHTVDMLKALVNLVADRNIPKRKADLVEFLSRQLAGDPLKKLWERLDRLQQAAVAETVHRADSSFHALRFKAKYGELPNWGETDMFRSYIRTPSLLGLFFYKRDNARGPAAMHEEACARAGAHHLRHPG